MLYSLALLTICLSLQVHKSQCAGEKVNVMEWPPHFSFKDEDGDGIKGKAGKDYPAYWKIPKTSFTCNGQPGQLDGYYADVEAGCQVFHLCINNKKTSFLCGNGTIFNQKLFTCDWWYYASCSDAPEYYSLNSKLYKEIVQEDKKATTSKEKEKLANQMRIQLQQHFSHSLATMKPVKSHQHEPSQAKKANSWKTSGLEKSNASPTSPAVTNNHFVAQNEHQNEQQKPKEKEVEHKQDYHDAFSGDFESDVESQTGDYRDFPMSEQ